MGVYIAVASHLLSACQTSTAAVAASSTTPRPCPPPQAVILEGKRKGREFRIIDYHAIHGCTPAHPVRLTRCRERGQPLVLGLTCEGAISSSLLVARY